MARAATVLIVDDDATMRQTMEAIVKSSGMRPMAVASGEEALRAVQEHETGRVGGARPIQLDLRVICATNRSLPEMVKEGRFREALYSRLNVVPIQVPPLRDRREDI